MNLARRRFVWILLGVGILALLLRLWNIDFGFPHANHRDEEAKYPVILRIAHGEPAGYLLHPGLLVNSVALVWRVGEFFGADDKFTTVTLLGRILVAFLGAGTAVFAGLLGRRLYGDGPGLLAAASLGASPLHSMLSRYVKEDIHLAFGLVGLLLALTSWSGGVRERRDRISLVAIVVAAGWCAASKYVGFCALIMVVAWCLHRAALPMKRRLMLAAGLLLGSLVVFVVLSPQVLDLARTREDFSFEMSHGLGQKNRLVLPFWRYPDWGTYFFLHGVGWGCGWPQAIIGAVAVIVAVRRGSAEERLVALTCFGWYVLGELTPVKLSGGVERYILPTVALLCVMQGRFALTGRGLAVLVGLLVIPLGHSVLLAKSITVDTRQQAMKWLEDNNPRTGFRMGKLRKPTEDDELRSTDGNIDVPFPYFKKDTLDLLDSLDGIAVSSNAYERYARSPWDEKSQEALKNLKRIRKRFHHVVLFSVPSFLYVGTHNPRIELRFRHPMPGSHEE